MKKLLTSIALACCAFSAHAAPQTKGEYCYKVSEVARGVIVLKKSGVPRQELMAQLNKEPPNNMTLAVAQRIVNYTYDNDTTKVGEEDWGEFFFGECMRLREQ